MCGTNKIVSMSIKESSTNNENKKKLEQSCSEIYAVNLISGRWILSICYCLKQGKLRFSELKNKIPNITERMLTMQLKKMEEEQLIVKKVYAEVPPRVEYELTQIGTQLIPVLDELEMWGKEHKKIKNSSN
ncbi:transcriptional regulator, HxlR family [Chryseobacterium oranimense]|uniref:Transcriptional regulator, HxlR family n=2 Tax=Chryseobacterium oranimense TaxID=421058 RepID=A0A1M5LGV0_9FLAO|nr:transcriptional regulator, HxlR family [Chryseobacterium oranimense]